MSALVVNVIAYRVVGPRAGRSELDWQPRVQQQIVAGSFRVRPAIVDAGDGSDPKGSASVVIDGDVLLAVTDSFEGIANALDARHAT